MVTFCEMDKELICTFSGQLDTLTVMKDEPAVNAEIGQGRARGVAFDLGGVTFISSSFLRLCLKTAKAAGGSPFSLRNLTPEVKKVFVISGLDKQLPIT